MPITKAEKKDDGYYYIEFGLTTNTPDLENEQVTDKCLDDMIKQAKNINGFEGHNYGLDSVIGPVVDAWKEKTGKSQMMYVKVRVKPSMEKTIKELVETGVRLGGSIGGLYVKDYTENGIRMLEKVRLLDATLTPLPVNFDTLGTARETAKKCENSICHQIVKSIQDRYFEKASNYQVNSKAVSHATSLINSGKINEGSWSPPSAGDFDSVSEYAKYCLGKKEDGDPEAAGTYGFPIGKGGEIYRKGVIAAKSAAAGARSGTKNEAIYNAADKLLKLIEKKRESGDNGSDDESGNKSMEDENMDDKMVKELIEGVKEANQELAKEITANLKEALQPEPDREDGDLEDKKEPVKEIDKNELAKEVLEIMGIEIPEDEDDKKETSKGYIVLSEDGLKSLVKETILEYTKENRDPDKQRKSKSQGGGKFEDLGDKIDKSNETSERDPMKVNGQIIPNPLKTKSIKDLAEGTAHRMGLKT